MHGESAAPSNAQSVDLYRADGGPLKSITGADEAVWLDSERLIVTTWLRRQVGQAWEVVYGVGGQPVSESHIAFVSSDNVEAVEDELAGAISNGRGILAAPRCGQCDPNESRHSQRSFVLWTESEGATQEFPGEETAFSLSGDELLVLHPLGDGPNRRSWPEILEVPGLHSVYSAPDLREPVVLDPTWSYAAHWSGQSVHIVDLSTNADDSFATDHIGPGAWDASGRLVKVDYDSASAGAYTRQGVLEMTFDDVGNSITSSADGSALALWFFDQVEGTNTIGLVRGNSVAYVSVPGQLVTLPGPLLSPTGSAIAIVTLGDTGSLVFVASL
jgi:hypothetical protein